MTEPRPDEFIEFLDLLTQDAPRGYEPWLFRVERGSKAPDLSYGSWKDEDARLDRDEAIRWMQSGGNVGIAGRPDDPLINVDIDDEDATTIDDLKPTLIARSRSRTGVHAWYFEAAGDDIPNIPTDEAGEVRANWQYVVAPGSYVETDTDAVPADEREHAGYYTVERADPVTSLRLSELPEVFQEHNNPDPDAQDIEVPDRGAFAADDTGGDQSALFDISARDVVRREGGGSTNPGDRWTAIFHGSDTGKNMSLSGQGQLHCWRHEVAHNGLQALAVLSDYSGDCERVGAGHKQSGAGSSCLHHEDGAHIWHAWKYAKESGYIPEDDPVPYSALKHVCRDRGICPESEIPDEYDPDSADGRLPADAYNAAIETIEADDGLTAGREKTDEFVDDDEQRTPQELVAEHSDEFDSPEDVPDDLFDEGGETAADGGADGDSDDEDEDEPDTWGLIRLALAEAENADERREPRYEAAMELNENHHFANLQENETLWCYNPEKGIYEQTGTQTIRRVLTEQLRSQYRGQTMSVVDDHIRGRNTIPQDQMGGPEGKIASRNKVIDIKADTTEPHSPEHMFTSRLGTEFDATAECPQWQAFLDQVVSSDTDRAKLQEYVGYCLHHWSMPYHKALFLVGPTASGKSTFLDTVNALLGEDTVASLTPQQLTTERFAPAEIYGKWANIRNDIPKETVKNTGTLKEVLAGDPLKAEEKRKDPFFFRPTAKHLFSANQLPEMEVDDEAFFRRILLVPFPETVPKADRDKHLADKLSDELPGILNWALEGLQRLLANGSFTGDRSPGRTQETWSKWGDSVERFASIALTDGSKDIPKSDVYDAYLEFCRSEGMPSDTQHMMTRELKREGYTDGRANVDGRTQRCFEAVAWTSRGQQLLDAAQDGDSEQFGGLSEYQ